MRITLTAETYHPERRYLEYYLARELAILGHEVNLISFTGNRTLEVKKDTSGFILHTLPYIGLMQGYHIPSLSAMKHIISNLKEQVPDVIHCQPLFSPLSMAVTIFGRQLGSRIVGSLISGPYSIDSAPSYVNFILSKLVTESYIKRVTKFFFAKSRGLKRVLMSLYNLDSKKIPIIPLGADHEVFVYDENSRCQIRKELYLKDNDLLILWSGRLTAAKQVDILLKAAAPIIKLNPQVKLLIKGEGDDSYLDYLNKLSRNLGISSNVIFQGLADHEELPAFFSASDFAVWPGGASISMVEAASCGLPLISMKSPIEEYVITPENGLLFEPGNVSELRGHLEQLINNMDLRKEMGRNSRMLVERRLNWKTIARQYVESYERAQN
jgi:glycosyltransferase involved in cell wall biosynthesis